MRRLASIVLLLTLSMSAGAQTRLAQQDLYLDAMHSLADGRPEDASDTLTRMIEQEPQHAGAWLDLAIIQCELGHAAEAERLFQVIETRFSPPPGIVEVIANRRASGCKGWQPRSQMSLTLGRGIDGNVNQGASNPFFSIGSGSLRIEGELPREFLPQRDRYTLLSGEYTRDLDRHGSLGFAQLRVRQNDSLSRYNTASLRFGIEHPWNVDNWGLRGIGSASLLTLGGQLYQRQGQLEARVSPPLKLPEAVQFNLLTGLTRVEYPTVPNFNSTNLEFGGLLTYRTERSQTQASAGYLFDHGDGNRLGGDRQGWFASVQSQFRVAGNVTAELGWTSQTWLSQSPYSPGLFDQVRRQDTQLLRAALNVPLKPQHSLQIEWRKIKNDENISIFQYNSQLFQLSWQWQGF